MTFNHVRLKTCIVICLAFYNLTTEGQVAEAIPFDSLHWNFQGQTIKSEVFKEVPCLAITNGAASLKDNFENGSIDFDISFDKQRSFPGVFFRMTDPRNFDFLYLRPHQSGNPDAIQYCPVINGLDTWQLYFGEGYCAQTSFLMNSWIHVKLIISGEKAALYLNNDPIPVLSVDRLQRDAISGGLALDNHSPATVRFANFKYFKEANLPIPKKKESIGSADSGIVTKWQLSAGFNEKYLDSKNLRTANNFSKFTRKAVDVEERGFINIGRYLIKTADTNTALCSFIIESDQPQIKKMRVGFSDYCRIYLNGKILYEGSNIFKSRDYRFYGTIGFWDAVFLDLKKGKNEITIAVTENFGGWGVEARFDDLSNIILSR